MRISNESLECRRVLEKQAQFIRYKKAAHTYCIIHTVYKSIVCFNCTCVFPELNFPATLLYMNFILFHIA